MLGVVGAGLGDPLIKRILGGEEIVEVIPRDLAGSGKRSEQEHDRKGR
jgi:hypothetical protein